MLRQLEQMAAEYCDALSADSAVPSPRKRPSAAPGATPEAPPGPRAAKRPRSAGRESLRAATTVVAARTKASDMHALGVERQPAPAALAACFARAAPEPSSRRGGEDGSASFSFGF